MLEKFILSLFTKKETSKVLTIVKEKRDIKRVEIEREQTRVAEIKREEKKSLKQMTSLSNYFVGIKSLLSSERVILDKRKSGLLS